MDRNKRMCLKGMLGSAIAIAALIALALAMSGCWDGGYKPSGKYSEPIVVEVKKMPYGSAQSDGTTNVRLRWEYEDEQLLWRVRGKAFMEGMLSELESPNGETSMKLIQMCLERK